MVTATPHGQFGRLCRWAALIALASACAAANAQTTYQDVTNLKTDYDGFNLISFGNADLESYGDTQGGLAVNGALTLGGTGVISQNVTTNNSTLYVTGQLNLNGNTTLDSGYAYLPGLTKSQWTWNSSNQTLTSNTTGDALNSSSSSAPNAKNNPISGTSAPTGINFNGTALQTTFSGISTSLANAAATGTISVSGQSLVFSSGSQTSGVVVFNLDVGSSAGAGVLSGDTYNNQAISNVSVNVPAGLTYVINVVNAGGKTIFGSGVNLNSGTNDNQLLWNIEGSGTVTIGAQTGDTLYGSILAPNATIDTSTVITGEVAAGGFSDCGVELHDTDFAPALVTTPEPGTYALWAIGICAAGIVFRRRQRREETSPLAV
jgi:choice-of-anchor A domain-containing protein